MYLATLHGYLGCFLFVCCMTWAAWFTRFYAKEEEGNIKGAIQMPSPSSVVPTLASIPVFHPWRIVTSRSQSGRTTILFDEKNMNRHECTTCTNIRAQPFSNPTHFPTKTCNPRSLQPRITRLHCLPTIKQRRPHISQISAGAYHQQYDGQETWEVKDRAHGGELIMRLSATKLQPKISGRIPNPAMKNGERGQ